MTSQPSDHLINNHIALCTGPVWLPGSNSAEKFPCLLINWHWHWAYCPSISCIYVGIKQTHMPLKMIYSNFMSRIPPAVIFRKTLRHCSHHLCCALPRLSSPWCVFFYEIPSAIINYRSNYRAVQASEMAALRRGGNIPPVFYDMCQHSAKTDAKSWRSSSKRSDNWLLNCVNYQCQHGPCVIIWPQGDPRSITPRIIQCWWGGVWHGGHDSACSCPRYAESDMDTREQVATGHMWTEPISRLNQVEITCTQTSHDRAFKCDAEYQLNTIIGPPNSTQRSLNLIELVLHTRATKFYLHFCQ